MKPPIPDQIMPPTKTPKKKDARKGAPRSVASVHRRLNHADAAIGRLEEQQNMIFTGLFEGDSSLCTMAERLLKKVDFVNEDIVAQIETNRKYIIAIERKLDLVLSSNSLLQELDAKKEEQGKWRPAKGEMFKAADGLLRIAVEVDPEGAITYKMADGSKGGWMGCLVPVEKPSPEEIESSAYGEREGLERLDCCELTDELRTSLSGLGLPLFSSTTLLEPGNTFAVWTGTKLCGGFHAQGRTLMSGSQFLRLAKKEAEKLRAAREEEEAKKPLEPWTEVEQQGLRYRVLAKVPGTNPYAHYLWDPRKLERIVSYRPDFTVLNP